VTQAILPAFIVAGIVDAGFSREHALLRAGITSLRLKLRRDEPIAATTSSVDFPSRRSRGAQYKLMSMKIRIHSLATITVTLVTIAVLPVAQAVVPPPDGGYPGRNTAEGQKTLFSLTTGGDNTALGFLSLQALTSGNLNTGVGAWTLALNTADYNTACGAAALLFNGTGFDNTAVGTAALLFNTIGEGNTATGAFALYSNTEGDFNTANGEFTLYSNTIGERNTAIGDSALYSNIEGSRNTAIGNTALLNNSAGNENTAIGAGALHTNNADANTAVGADALTGNTSGSENTATGAAALSDNTSGSGNTAFGFHALGSNTQAFGNTAVGDLALGGNTTGGGNVALGVNAGVNQTTGTFNVYIGAGVMGTAGESNACYIRSIFGQTAASGVQVFVNADNKLGTMTSSQRFKKDIKPMAVASEALFELKPVTFRYKKEIDPTETPQLGLVAEEVENVNPDLVVRDKEGKPYSVRYDQVNAMLLNEFLKEHKKVEKLESTVASLAATVREQAGQIEKINTQIQMSKATPNLVLNTQ
jgi:hypothetical protein